MCWQSLNDDSTFYHWPSSSCSWCDAYRNHIRVTAIDDTLPSSKQPVSIPPILPKKDGESRLEWE